jgi:hypothetical protein
MCDTIWSSKWLEKNHCQEWLVRDELPCSEMLFIIERLKYPVERLKYITLIVPVITVCRLLNWCQRTSTTDHPFSWEAMTMLRRSRLCMPVYLLRWIRSRHGDVSPSWEIALYFWRSCRKLAQRSSVRDLSLSVIFVIFIVYERFFCLSWIWACKLSHYLLTFVLNLNCEKIICYYNGKYAEWFCWASNLIWKLRLLRLCLLNKWINPWNFRILLGIRPQICTYLHVG